MKLKRFIGMALTFAFALATAAGSPNWLCRRGMQWVSPGVTASPAVTNAVKVASIDAGGEYTSCDQVARYLRTYRRLPRNFITKAEARRLGWSGGPLDPYARGKSIGGDRFGNYEGRLPRDMYRECDIDTRGRSRGAKRLIYSADIQRIYYTSDHYRTFKEVP